MTMLLVLCGFGSPITEVLPYSKLFAASSIQTDGADVRLWQRPRSGWLYVLDPAPHNAPHNFDDDPRVQLVDPTNGLVRGEILTGYNPEISLSPDGTRLYLLHIVSTGSELVVIDTSSGEILKSVPAPPKIPYILVPHSSSMEVSEDSNWVYLFSMRSPGPTSEFDLYSLATFDVKTGSFLPERVQVGNCGPPLILPSTALELTIFCPHSNDIHQVTLEVDGSLRSASRLGLQGSIAATKGLLHNLVRTGFLTANNEPVALMGDGSLYKFDRQNHKFTKVRRVTDARILPNKAIISPDGSEIYISVSRIDRSSGRSEEILILDSESHSLIGAIQTTRPFWSLGISSDGRYLYAPTLHDKSVLIIDTVTRREIAELPNIGVKTPAIVEVAP